MKAFLKTTILQCHFFPFPLLNVKPYGVNFTLQMALIFRYELKNI